ncbi:MAG TPA: Gfo/Idh/MocA family oxidoreductase [Verrucomicrobiae bacterium]|jgi:predicted dehydrogenase
MFLRVYCFFLSIGLAAAADLKVGMIGLDTSHVVEFTRRLNDSADKDFIPGARVVVAFKGGSPDIPSSWNRVDGFTKTMREKYGVNIVDNIGAVLTEADVVMIENVDGRPHLTEALAAINARKPLFIDKPLAGSLRDALQIYRQAREKHVPIFSASSLRYYPNLQEMKSLGAGEIRGVVSSGPCELESHHPDLFWYGIHSTEALYTIMGAGCESVVCTATANTHVVTGTWKDGRVGTVWGLREAPYEFRMTVFGSKKVLDEKLEGDYTPFLREVVKFFQTRVSPVPSNETLEIYAFMEAADESKRNGGCPVKIADIIRKNGGQGEEIAK